MAKGNPAFLNIFLAALGLLFLKRRINKGMQ
jgi:hypothetical protein